MVYNTHNDTSLSLNAWQMAQESTVAKTAIGKGWREHKRHSPGRQRTPAWSRGHRTPLQVGECRVEEADQMMIGLSLAAEIMPQEPWSVQHLLEDGFKTLRIVSRFGCFEREGARNDHLE